METLGRYTLLRRVAAGGMAEIWKAKVSGPAGFEKQVAIKRVLPHLAEDREFVDMFVEEAKLVATLVHPNIVQVFDFGQIGESYFLAMEFVPGCNLDKLESRLMAKEVKLAAPVALYVAAEICRGLGAAHALTDAKGVSRNLVHRDVSPQNVLVSFGGAVKVGDFGIAKAVHLKSRTETGLVRGKSAFMSPEQARGEPLDARTDLFAAGVVLYEMISGHRLFEGRSTLDVMQKVAAWKGPGKEELEPIPEALREIFVTALAPARENRFSDALAMETAISWHLGADGAVRARQALGALVREMFADEAAREAADTGGAPAPADAHATLDAPALASEAIDSRKVTTRPPLQDIADRGQSRGGNRTLLALTVGGALVAGLGFFSVQALRHAQGSPTETPLSHPSGAATAESTFASSSATPLAPTTPVPDDAISPEVVDAQRHRVQNILAGRCLSLEDVPAAATELEESRAARNDGRLIDDMRALERAEAAINAVTFDDKFVSAKFDRVKAREKTIAAAPGVPTGELDDALTEARTLLDSRQFSAANTRLCDLDARLEQFKSRD
ncbi:MAG TPA: serine/threonine-protein kinase [bacterium]|nr:serine/threonine-protein kinase [bacterium]